MVPVFPCVLSGNLFLENLKNIFLIYIGVIASPSVGQASAFAKASADKSRLSCSWDAAIPVD